MKDEEAVIIDDASSYIIPNEEFVNELREHDVNCRVKIDPDGYCRRIFKSDKLEVIKHTCGCVSDGKRTLSFARKIGRKVSQSIIAKLSELRFK